MKNVEEKLVMKLEESKNSSLAGYSGISGNKKKNFDEL